MFIGTFPSCLRGCLAHHSPVIAAEIGLIGEIVLLGKLLYGFVAVQKLELQLRGDILVNDLLGRMFAHCLAHLVEIIAAYIQGCGIGKHFARPAARDKQLLDECHKVIFLARKGVAGIGFKHIVVLKIVSQHFHITIVLAQGGLAQKIGITSRLATPIFRPARMSSCVRVPFSK